MVFMSSTISDLLLSDAQTAHSRVLTSDESSPLHRAFLSWLLPSRFAIGDVIDEYVRASCIKRGGARSYRDLALIGFVQERVMALGLVAERDNLINWIQGTSVRLSSGYDAIVDDPIGILGVMLAVESTNKMLSGNGRRWLEEVCKVASTGEAKEPHSSTFRAVEYSLQNTEVQTDISADVAVALQSKGMLRINPSLYSLAFLQAKVIGPAGDIYTAAVRLAALDWIQGQAAIDVGRPDVSQVRRILSGAQSSLYRWVWEDKPKTRGGKARRWHVENEYHFQSLLYAILRPIFPDLKEEEYTVSVGTTQPRADLYIPSLKLVIEVKFWYRNSNSRTLINELAADASLYRAKGSEVQCVIPIIWDDARRTQEHSVIQDGVQSLEGLSSAIFVNRPSTWSDD